MQVYIVNACLAAAGRQQHNNACNSINVFSLALALLSVVLSLCIFCTLPASRTKHVCISIDGLDYHIASKNVIKNMVEIESCQSYLFNCNQ